MIKEISAENFKCFKSLNLQTQNVNVFSGINGMGKSTVIQILLLLRQTYQIGHIFQGLNLNGRYTNLGTAQDILYEKAEDEYIALGCTMSARENNFKYQYVADSDFLPLISDVYDVQSDDIFGNRFSYLSAYRIEPQKLYGITNEKELESREFGNNGEFALQYLNVHGNDDVGNLSVILGNKEKVSLEEQTKAWMDKIAPGVVPRVFVNGQQRTSEVRYEFIEGALRTNAYKSMNVGFGITYVLPLVVAILSAQKGDIIVAENPEAHIHPAGQRMLGELIAKAGAGGVQFFVETHSDHLLNGLRLSVKQGHIDKESIRLAFFYKDEEDDFKHKYICPAIQKDGRLDIWPEGFFDEWDKALYEFI